MIFTKTMIKQYLPHRDPFLYVDEIKLLDKKNISSPKYIVGLEIEGKVHLPADHFCFKGHFPNNPILPGVIQIEILAQTGLFGFAYLFDDPLAQNLSFRLIKALEFKFKKEARPGDYVMKARAIKERAGFVEFEGELFQNDVMVSQGRVLGMALNNNQVIK